MDECSEYKLEVFSLSNLNEWIEFNIKNGAKTFVNRIQAIIIEEIMKN